MNGANRATNSAAGEISTAVSPDGGIDEEEAQRLIIRRHRYSPEVAREVVAEKNRLGVQVLWMQLGVISEEAEKIGKDAGLTVVMNRCPKIEHGRFSGEIGWMGVNRKVIDNRKPLLFGKGGSLRNN